MYFPRHVFQIYTYILHILYLLYSQPIFDRFAEERIKEDFGTPKCRISFSKSTETMASFTNFAELKIPIYTYNIYMYIYIRSMDFQVDAQAFEGDSKVNFYINQSNNNNHI